MTAQYVQPAPETRQRLPYGKLAFMFKKPHSNSIFGAPFRIADREQHREVIRDAKSRDLRLWYADVEERDGHFYMRSLHIADFDSFGEDADEEESGSSLTCSKCGRECSSTSGLTLHMKSCSGDDGCNPDDDDSVGEDSGNHLKCPVCNKQCSSTSGYTLHMKRHK